MLSLDGTIYIPVWLALISVVPQVMTTVLNFVIAIRTRKTHEAISTLEKNTNGIQDALLTVTGEAERAKGVLEGREQAKGEMNERS